MNRSTPGLPVHHPFLMFPYFLTEAELVYNVVQITVVRLSDSVAHQAPPSMGLSRQEYWSGLACPPPGHLLNLRTKPRSPALQVDSLLLSHQGSL